MELLRLLTAGNVDDGKSTLIGRLLYETQNISEEEIKSLTRSQTGQGDIDLARLLDGLKDEREQGITIDVAYRHFRSSKRRFIIADCPGHVQYTKNLIVGAANSDIALILIDANRGVVDQTRRHIKILKLLKVSHFVFVINKMDSVKYEKTKFDEIVDQVKSELHQSDEPNSIFIPVSAKSGDNVVRVSDQMNWYLGPTVLECLEQVPISSTAPIENLRLVVQKTILDPDHKTGAARAYAAKLFAGALRQGDYVHFYPSKTQGKIKNIFDGKTEIHTATFPSSILFTLENDLDVERGSVVVSNETDCSVSDELSADIFWLDSNPISDKKNYVFRHTCQESVAKIKMATSEQTEFAHIDIKLSKAIWFDNHKENQTTGLCILIDPLTNNTVGVGLID